MNEALNEPMNESMNAPLKRRNLLAAPPVTPPLFPEEAIAAVAARNGFSVAGTAVSATVDPLPRRRQRQPTGRDHQFNVRLRQETLDFIYGLSNERNIPIAQVIEEGMEALKRQQGAR